MFKKLISSLLAASMLATFASAASGNTQTAKPSPHAIYVDGTKANVAAYEINDNNYFKLRDIAAIVNGSEKQFEVSWNYDAQRIDLTSGKPYTTVGGELGAIGSASKQAETSTAVVYKDNVKMGYTGYNIDDNNYYKLRDVCESFNIGIKWDGANQRVDILTDESYVDENEAVTPDDETDETEKPEENSTPGTVPAEKPAVGEYSDEYLAYLENSGDKIVTVTVKYEFMDMYNKLFTKAVPVTVTQIDADLAATTFMSDSSGKGEFTIKMTQSDYAAIMAGNHYIFALSFTDEKGTTFDGRRCRLGGNVDSYAMLGYRTRFIVTYLN